MNIQTNAPAPLILLLGIAFLAGACALAYFSSPATLKAMRTGRRRFRFLFAQACVLFLSLVGAFLLWLGMRTLFPDPNAGIGPR